MIILLLSILTIYINRFVSKSHNHFYGVLQPTERMNSPNTSPRTPVCDFETFQSTIENISNFQTSDSQLSKRINDSLHNLVSAIEVIGIDKFAVTLNGGKESIVSLYLFFAAISKYLTKHPELSNTNLQEIITEKIIFIFFDRGDNFPEVLHYVNMIETLYIFKLYSIDLQ